MEIRIGRMIKNTRKKLSKMQIIALGFFLLIMGGTLLLMLPISSRNGTVTPFLDCMFTATSASCVTGLVVVDTYTHWSFFGQLVIITMIQIGGLGFMTFGVLLAMAMHRRIGLRERGLISESLNAMQLGGVVGFVRKILIGTLIIEGTGAILLSIRFIPEFGLIEGVGNGIFHSISAFCNAGFDLMGKFEPYSSLTRYSGDWLVNLTIMSLVIIGGIGFLVWDDIIIHKWHFKKFHVHSKIVLITTGILVFGGALLFAVFERNNLSAHMGGGETFLTAMFDSVTARTAGFNTTDTAALSQSSKLLTTILMFIGGSPGSTAGGIKTTTVVVFIMYMRASMMRTRGINIFKRRIDDEAIKKASAVLCINLLLSLGAVMLICTIQPLQLTDVMFEAMSGIGTVGMTTGITRDLLPVSRIAVMILMYCGRLGSLSFALSFTERKKISPIELPQEKILVG